MVLSEWLQTVRGTGSLRHGAFSEGRSATEINSKTPKACHSLSSKSLFLCRARPALVLCIFGMGLSS